MATKKYLDLEGLGLYDEKLKEYVKTKVANQLTGALFVVHSLTKKHPYSYATFGVNSSSYAGYPVKYLKDGYTGLPLYDKSLMREYMKQMTNTEYLPVYGEEIYFYENNGADIRKLYKVQLQELTPGNGELLCFFELGTPAEVFGLPDWNNVVKNTGDQSIIGVKTFSNSPIVPNAITSGQAVNKAYVDNAIQGAIQNAWNGGY